MRPSGLVVAWLVTVLIVVKMWKIAVGMVVGEMVGVVGMVVMAEIAGVVGKCIREVVGSCFHQNLDPTLQLATERHGKDKQEDL